MTSSDRVTLDNMNDPMTFGPNSGVTQDGNNAEPQTPQTTAPTNDAPATDTPIEKHSVKVVNQRGDEMFFTLKPNTKMEKLMKIWCERSGAARSSQRFLLEGKQFGPDATPSSLDMEAEDTIEVFEEQVGGTGRRPAKRLRLTATSGETFVEEASQTAQGLDPISLSMRSHADVQGPDAVPSEIRMATSNMNLHVRARAGIDLRLDMRTPLGGHDSRNVAVKGETRADCVSAGTRNIQWANAFGGTNNRIIAINRTLAGVQDSASRSNLRRNIPIRVRSLKRETLNFVLKQSMTAVELKDEIFERIGLHPEAQRLIQVGRQLEDNNPIYSNASMYGTDFYLLERMRSD